MAKRPTSESPQEQSPKRARTAESDDDDNDDDDESDVDYEISRQNRREARTRFNDDVQEHGETDNEEEEQKFEDAHAKKILADLASKRKIQGVEP